jgi:hypothetical protein
MGELIHSIEETAKGLTYGASDYIARPFSARELLVRVDYDAAGTPIRVLGAVVDLQMSVEAHLRYDRARLPLGYHGPRLCRPRAYSMVEKNIDDDQNRDGNPQQP